MSNTSKGLVYTLCAQRAVSKIPNVTDIGLKPRQIKKVAVIGGGLMGSGIATTLLLGNILVVVKEINTEYLQKGMKTIEGYQKKSRGRRVTCKSRMTGTSLDYREKNQVLQNQEETSIPESTKPTLEEEEDQVLQNQEETSIPKSTKPALEEEVIEEKEEEPQLMDEVEAVPAADTGDLLGLTTEINPLASQLEDSNAMALAIVPPGGDPTNPGFANFGGNASGWELALVTNPSSNTTHVTESKLAGGFDRLLLDSLYEDTTSRGQPQNVVYGGGMSVQNPFDPRDPFSMSSNIAPPTNVQMAMLQQQQHQLMFQHQQHHQQQNMMMVPHQYSQQQQYLPQYSQQQ
ncbi:hypothetical protein GIB67_018772 [Kingdonia uniflora]|uniref:3-hydroxyacyl-CoA dehydrogenase NAD binding domain-containing protein n=1 Tax=Kingdonia uniflora TaxID=39325 RepID=A0A7J7NEN2_9MAGN|nr:hypothetical protein GIB67_018772 [Kingdonia uniflora]